MSTRPGPAGEGRPASAAPADALRQGESELAALLAHPVVRTLLDAAGVTVAVLDRERKLLLGDSALLATLRTHGHELTDGAPGDVLGCVHAAESARGCGGSPECAACGALGAALESQACGGPLQRECLMTVRGREGLEALELRVRASQLKIAGRAFTVLGLQDISADKRRAALERLFLHDVSNTLAPLVTWAQLLAAQASAEGGTNALARRVAVLATRLQRDIDDQRVLLQAEQGLLQPVRSEALLARVLEEARDVVDGHPAAAGRSLEASSPEPCLSVVTDASLLVRVLVNMMKNALEATPPGGVVKAWAARGPSGCELRVWNAGVIPAEVALQIFKRSFSTKSGSGRGLGTFSIKLIGERYLGGSVGFTSTAAEGTCFFIRLPV